MKFAPKIILIVLIAALGFALAQAPQAIGSLYQRGMSGDLSFTCTASIVAGSDLALDFEHAVITAAHCLERGIEHDDVTEEWFSKTDYLVSFDEVRFYALHPVRVGIADKGYDVAIMRFIDEPPDVTPIRIGHWGLVEVGTVITSWANPAGLGLQRFEGYLSMLNLQRPVEGAQINWRGYAIAILPGAGGSSGSLVLSEGRVIGIHIGSITPSGGARFSVLVPVHRLAAFMASDAAGRPIRE